MGSSPMLHRRSESDRPLLWRAVLAAAVPVTEVAERSGSPGRLAHVDFVVTRLGARRGLSDRAHPQYQPRQLVVKIEVLRCDYVHICRTEP